MVLCYNKYGFATEIEIERSLLHEMDVIFQKACGSHSCSVGSRDFDVLESALFRNLELSGLECLVNVVLLNGSGGRIPKNWRFSELGRCLLQALEIQSDAGIFALESLLFSLHAGDQRCGIDYVCAVYLQSFTARWPTKNFAADCCH